MPPQTILPGGGWGSGIGSGGMWMSVGGASMTAASANANDPSNQDSAANLELSAARHSFMKGNFAQALRFAERLIKYHPGTPQAQNAQMIVEKVLARNK